VKTSKTPKAYFDSFKAEFLKWQKELGLMQYRIDFFHEPVKDGYAQIIVYELSKTARVSLSKDLGKNEVDAGPESHARHEVLHLLTNRLRWLGCCRYIGDDDLSEEWEAVVVRLDKVLK